MSDWYEATGRRSAPGSFLMKPEWSMTTTASVNVARVPHMGIAPPGTPYQCPSAGLPGIPHMPKMSNQFWGVGDTFNEPTWHKNYVDDCVACGARIQNRYNFDTWRWDGWRPTATVPPTCIIEEEPF